MPRAPLPTGIELEYDSFGDPDDPTMVLVMGFMAQMIAWDPRLCELLAATGRHVVRFDNRDCGLSSKLDGAEVDVAAIITAAITGTPAPPVPYTLSEMAADVCGLLDHLGVERAHVVGASMGGMIVQTMAIEHPHRLLSMTSVMSCPGHPIAHTTPEAVSLLVSPQPVDRAGAIERAVQYELFSSKRYFDVDLARAYLAASYDRCNYPQGAPRHMAAITATGDRSAGLATLDLPTLVIHGLDDALITPSGGRHTAELIPGATLLELADMGHDLPEPLWPAFVDAVHTVTTAGEQRAAA